MKLVTYLGKPAAAYLVLAAFILGPLLLPGYILTLDMVFTPQLPPPAYVSSSHFFTGALWLFDQLLPADVVQKLLLLAIFTLAGWGMHRLVSLRLAGWTAATPMPVAACYAAGVLYVLNPFTYDRLMAGQYAVLAGYALLPWLLRAALLWASRPGWPSSLTLLAWALAVSIVSIHSILPAALLIGLVLGVRLAAGRRWPAAPDGPDVGQGGRRLLAWAAVLTGGWLALSSYWLLPLLAGRTRTAEVIGAFTTADRQAFATIGNGLPEQLANVLGLQGFWAEAYDLYQLPQNAIASAAWLLAMLAVILLVARGGVALCKGRQRRLLAVAAAAIMCGALLGTGVGLTALSQFVPLLAGYREPQKFVMLVALGYGLLAAYGAAALLRQRAGRPYVRRFAAAVLIALPLATVPVMPWAATGQLRAVQYPAGWQAVADRLSAANGTSGGVGTGQDRGAVLALPWHLYLNVDFAARVVANPAPKYFGTLTGRDILYSADPELRGAAQAAPTAAGRQADGLVRQALRGDTAGFTAGLRRLDVRYVILAKDSDFMRYQGWLDDLPELQRLYDDETIRLYRLRD